MPNSIPGYQAPAQRQTRTKSLAEPAAAEQAPGRTGGETTAMKVDGRFAGNGNAEHTFRNTTVKE